MKGGVRLGMGVIKRTMDDGRSQWWQGRRRMVIEMLVGIVKAGYRQSLEKRVSLFFRELCGNLTFVSSLSCCYGWRLPKLE